MSNSFRILTLSGFLLVTVLGISSAHAVQLINVAPVRGSRCLRVEGGSTANGTPIQGAPCNFSFIPQDATFFQEFNWEGPRIQGIGTTFERGPPGGKCLDVLGGGTADRTPVQLFDCNLSSAQQWNFSNGRIINVRSGKCLDVDLFSDGPAVTPARIFTCSDIRSVGQLWFIR